MTSQVQIAPELVRLAQARVQTTGTPLSQELSRMVIEESITRLDPELGFLIDADQSWSGNDALVAAIGVNDVVVNGLHIDVRVLDANAEVSVSRALIGTACLVNGTLVVEMISAHSGRLAGYIPASTWMAADRKCGDTTNAVLQFSSEPNSDLAATLEAIPAQSVSNKARGTAEPDLTELAKFVASRSQLSLQRQRQIVESALLDQKVLMQFEKMAALWSDGTLSRILTADSVWNSRVETLAGEVQPKFKASNKEEIKRQIRITGEQFGGQPESPQFRKALYSNLVRQEVLKRFQGADLTKLAQAVDRVLSGRPVVDAVKDLIKSRFAVDAALVIKNHRKKLSEFMTVSADEIAMAFNQLALRPAYATHSADKEDGTEQVNEALAMLQACELAEELARLAEGPA